MKNTNNNLTIKEILIWAVWFGSVTGIVEGFALWSFHQLGWLSGKLSLSGSTLENIWVSAFFDLLLFFLFGLLLILLGKYISFILFDWIIASLFFFLLILNWLNILLNARISIIAIVVLALGTTVQFSWWFQKNRKLFTKIIQKSLRILIASILFIFIGVQGIFWLNEKIVISDLPVPASDLPNIVVIVVDTLRADHLSSYGYDRPTSENIDKLAREGVLFENAYSTAPYTLPSHASMLTGLYSFSHQAYDNPLDDKYPTIGETLQDLGYRSAAFSANVSTFNRSNGFERGFIHFEDHYRSIGDMIRNTVYGRFFEYYVLYKLVGYQDELGRMSATDINNSALRWINSQKDGPFFIFINYYDVHSPYIPPNPFRNKFASIVKDPGGLISSYWSTENLYVELTPDQLQSEVNAYDGDIAYVDNSIGQLLANLKKQGLLENTLVVVTSDHGESFGEHGLRGHANALYRELIHVPLIIWWPGHLPIGEHISKPVSLVSIPPTLMTLIGKGDQIDYPYPSLSRLWQGNVINQVDIPFPLAELGKIPWAPKQNPSAYGTMQSVINLEWQYITHEKFGEEFFNLKNDPQENSNLINDQASETIIEFFRSYAEKMISVHK